MNIFIIFYIIGVLAFNSIVFIANKKYPINTWKVNVVLKWLFFSLGSWIAVYVIAILLALNDY